MKKRIAVIVLLAALAAMGSSGCSRKKPAAVSPSQTVTEPSGELTEAEETTIEPFDLTTEAPEQTETLETLEPSEISEPSDAPGTAGAQGKIGDGTHTGTDGRNNRLIIASDLHYLAEELTDGGEAFTYMVEHGDGKLANYVWEITDAFIGEVIEAQPQALILSGDLSLNGEKRSHEELAAKLSEIEDAGIPVVVIPGNHDINNPKAAAFKEAEHYPAETASPEDFVNIYYDFGYSEALSRDEHSLSYTYQLDDFNRLLMLDSCQYDQGVALVGGMIKLETYSWIEEQLAAAWDEGMNVIPVSHHNLMDESQVYVDDCTIEHSEELMQKLCDWKVPWYLSGHLHVQHFKSSEDYGIDEIVTSSLSTAPCQYGVIEYWDDGSFSYVTKAVDVAAWARKAGGKDKNLLEFPEYARTMLERVFYNKVMDTYKNSTIPPARLVKMAKLYAKLNVYSYAGKAVDIVSEVTENPDYGLWEEYGSDSILYQYMEEIVRDAVQDYNAFVRD